MMNKSNGLLKILKVFGIGLILFVFFLLIMNKIMKSSDAYKVSIEHIEKNQEIIKELKMIKDYGFMPTGRIKTENGFGTAKFKIKVIGESKNLFVNTYLEKTPNGEWKLLKLNTN